MHDPTDRIDPATVAAIDQHGALLNTLVADVVTHWHTCPDSSRTCLGPLAHEIGIATVVNPAQVAMLLQAAVYRMATQRWEADHG